MKATREQLVEVIASLCDAGFVHEDECGGLFCRYCGNMIQIGASEHDRDCVWPAAQQLLKAEATPATPPGPGTGSS